jgi:hypothetical protein
MSPFVMSCAMLALGQVRKPIPYGWAELLMSKAVFGCAWFYKGKKVIFCSLGHVYQTGPNGFFDSFILLIFSCFSKQAPNDFQKNLNKLCYGWYIFSIHN